MRNLLSANIFRLLKSRLFWGMEAAIAAYSIFVFYMGRVNLNSGVALTIELFNINSYLFHSTLWVGVTMACFAGFYIGTEYGDGTVRNKLIAGHGRGQVFLANFLTVFFVGVMQVITYGAVGYGVGTIFLGSEIWRDLSGVPYKTLLTVALLLENAAVATFLAMLLANKAKIVFCELLLSLFFMMAGMAGVNGLLQPETISAVQLDGEGNQTLVEDSPNKKYLEKAEREVYEWVCTLLPSAWGMDCVAAEGDDSGIDGKYPVGLFVYLLVFVGGGVCIFRRQDLK